MSESDKEILEESVHSFIENIIYRATTRNIRKSYNLSTPNHTSGLVSLIERILDLFTFNRQYKWQLDETYNIVPYLESHRRITLILITVSSILLITCSTLTIIVGMACVNSSEHNVAEPYIFQETGKSIISDRFHIIIIKYEFKYFRSVASVSWIIFDLYRWNNH